MKKMDWGDIFISILLCAILAMIILCVTQAFAAEEKKTPAPQAITLDQRISMLVQQRLQAVNDQNKYEAYGKAASERVLMINGAIEVLRQMQAEEKEKSAVKPAK